MANILIGTSGYQYHEWAGADRIQRVAELADRLLVYFTPEGQSGEKRTDA